MLDTLNSADYTILKQRNSLSVICYSFTYSKNISYKWDDMYLNVFITHTSIRKKIQVINHQKDIVVEQNSWKLHNMNIT